MEKPLFSCHDQVYVEYLIPVLLQTFKIDPWTIWPSKLTIQVSSGLQFSSSWCAEKSLNLLFNYKFHILSRCLCSTSPLASWCICGELPSHQTRLVPLPVMIRWALASDYHDLLHVTNHTYLHDHFCWNTYQNHLHMWLVTQKSKSWDNLA